MPLPSTSPARGVAAAGGNEAPAPPPVAPRTWQVPRPLAQHLGRALLLSVDCGIVFLALGIGYALRFEVDLPVLPDVAPASLSAYFQLGGLLAVLAVLLCQSWGLFRLASLHSMIEEVEVIAKAVTVATATVLAVTFFYRDISYSRVVFAFFWPVCVLLLSCAQLGFRRWQVQRYRAGLDRRRAVFVGRGGSYLADRLVSEPAFGLDVVGSIEPVGATASDPGHSRTLVASAGAGEHRARPLQPLGDLGKLGDVLDHGGIDEVLVVDQDLTHRALLDTLDTCESRGVMVRLVPAIYDLLVEPDDFSYVHGVPLLRVDERRFHWLSRLTKRVMDIGVSSLLLVLLLPAFALLWLLIRTGSKGPALFVQTRAGEGGRPFRMYKFRTMVDGAEARLRELVDVDALAQPMFKLERDPRVTKLGAFLRRTSLDELPQLWNVLKGDMSLVGPRPEELRMVQRYDVWQRRRLKVKPGITGLQQVEARGTLSELNDRVRLDIYYIRKRSLLLDLVILLRTVGAVLRGKGAA